MAWLPSSVESAAVEQAVDAAGVAGRLGGAEEAEEQAADDAADQVDADDVERVVEAEPVLQADREGAERAGEHAEQDRADHGTTNAQAGVIATRPATAPEAAPSVVAWPSRSLSTMSQPSSAAAGRDLGVGERSAGGLVGARAPSRR